MESNNQSSTQTPLSDEVRKLAVDIDSFWCNFDPYEEVYNDPRSQEDKELNVLFIEEDINLGGTDTIERLRGVVDDPFMSEVAEDAQALLSRINSLIDKINLQQ